MDENQFEKILDAFTDSIRAISRKYFLVGGSSDDLFQEGVIGLLEAFQSFDKSRGDYTSNAFRAFANVCIKRRIIDAIKKANSQKNQALNSYVSINQENDSGTEINLNIDGSVSIKDPEQLLLLKEETDEQINLIEDGLTEFESQVLDGYLEGLTQSKIAENLGKNIKQIDNTIQRIKRKAKNKIGKNESF